MLSGSLLVELVKLLNRKTADTSGVFNKYTPLVNSEIPDYIYVDDRQSSSGIKSKLLSLTEYAEEQRDIEKLAL